MFHGNSGSAHSFSQRGKLDSCFPNTTYLNNLLTDIRAKIGENALIVANVNWFKLTTTELSKINGVLMENGRVGTGAPQPSWAIVRDALDWNETYARNPKVNCLLDYYSTSPDNAADLQRMRAITALALTHSNGYVNFRGDTQYNWYDPFWSDHNLGRPLGSRYTIPGNAERRDFKNGSAVYNEVGHTAITISFPEWRRDRATNNWGYSFTLQPGDGGIYTFN
jgi:hypothetical protein